MRGETMIAAVIVTYNRKELLGENIQMLLKQTYSIDRICIVDNCSTDGTSEYLQKNGWKNNQRFVYIRTESNIGGAGGFYIGTKAAFEFGANWILLMDDDGKMADRFMLENLMSVAERLYKNKVADRKLFINALVQQGEMLSFKMGTKYTVQQALEAARNGILEGEANPFNGTVISRELVEKIGYPNKAFFIKGDEVDYKQRTLAAGGYIATVVNARYLHPRPEMQEKTVLGIKVPFIVEAPWKEYYTARNFTYMYKSQKHYKAIVFEIIFVKLLAVFSLKCRKTSIIKMMLKGVYDGWKGKLGPNVRTS